MKIIIDDIENLLFPDNEENLGQLLCGIEDWVLQNNRAVVKYEVDGFPLFVSDSPDAQFEINKIERLHVTTTLGNLLPGKILVEIHGQLRGLIQGLEEVPSLLQKGEREKAFTIFSEKAAIWGEVTHALIRLTSKLKFDIDRIGMPDKKANDRLQELVEHLKEMEKNFKNADLVGLNDGLCFELLPKLKEFKEGVGRFLMDNHWIKPNGNELQ